MSGFVLLILILSTFMHAGWNPLMRRRKSEAAFFTLQMYVVIAAAGLVPMAVTVTRGVGSLQVRLRTPSSSPRSGSVPRYQAFSRPSTVCRLPRDTHPRISRWSIRWRERFRC